MVTTIQGNEGNFTTREVSLARQARDLKRVLGYPSDKDLAEMVRTGIRDAPIDVNDIKMYFDNFTKNIEGTIINYTGGDISLAEIKKLKDQFKRLKSAADMDNLYYASLWADLNGYLSKTLDKKSFESWGKITEKLTSEKGSNWRWVSWKELISDARITKEAQESLLKNSKGGNKTVLESIFTSQGYQFSFTI
jgi:hypothetical protein